VSSAVNLDSSLRCVFNWFIFLLKGNGHEIGVENCTKHIPVMGVLFMLGDSVNIVAISNTKVVTVDFAAQMKCGLLTENYPCCNTSLLRVSYHSHEKSLHSSLSFGFKACTDCDL
jgi:hypothetical protein